MFPDKFSIGINEEKCASFIYEWKTKISWISNLPLMHPCVSLLRVYNKHLHITLNDGISVKNRKKFERKEKKKKIKRIFRTSLLSLFGIDILEMCCDVEKRCSIYDRSDEKCQAVIPFRRIAWWYISILFWRECPSTIQAQDCKNLGSTERP